MPDIDVSDLLNDPFAAELLTILRQKETVTQKGRESNTYETITPQPVGVVQPKDTVIGGNEVTREDDKIYRGAALIIHTQFRLRGPAPGYQPDVIVWQGDRYVITLVNNFSRYGAGFIYAEAASQESLDAPPEEGPEPDPS